jgi:hypothetical protein
MVALINEMRKGNQEGARPHRFRNGTMTTLTRLVTVIGGLALQSAPAYPQDGGRRFEPPPRCTGGAWPNGVWSRPHSAAARRSIPGWEMSTIRKDIDLGARGTLEVSNGPGEIKVRGTDGNMVRITATKRVKDANRDSARALMQNIVIRVSERGGGVEIFTELPSGKNAPISSTTTSPFPMSASVSLRVRGRSSCRPQRRVARGSVRRRHGADVGLRACVAPRRTEGPGDYAAPKARKSRAESVGALT